MIDEIGKLENLLANLAVIQHHWHSRSRVYPQVAGATITLISDGVADIFGAWVNIVPINIIDFEYKVIGVVIHGVDVASTYFIQLGFSLTDDATPPATAQILGERTKLITDVPIAQATEVLEFYSMECPANAKLWGRLKTDGGATDEAYITVLVMRHIEITNPIPHLTTWPWSA